MSEHNEIDKQQSATAVPTAAIQKPASLSYNGKDIRAMSHEELCGAFVEVATRYQKIANERAALKQLLLSIAMG